MMATQTILSDSRIFVVQTQTRTSNSRILVVQTQTIASDARIQVSAVSLKLYKESAPSVEIGTSTNPIVFLSATAGTTLLHPNNPFLLYNDKGGSIGSVDARNVELKVLELRLLEENVGTSNGTASQVFTVAFIPIVSGDSNNPVTVKVGSTIWAEVTSLSGQTASAEVYVVNYTSGTITFGNDVNGKIPPNTNIIYVSYSPNTARYGKEARDDGWLGVQSTGVASNTRTLTSEKSTVIDTTHVQAIHTPIITPSGVTSVYLTSDPNGKGTNYFTGGTYNDSTGSITLGTALPGSETHALVTYKYTILDDAEATFTQLDRNNSRIFANPIPSNNAKKLNLQVVIPSAASPSNGINVQFRLQLKYTEY